MYKITNFPLIKHYLCITNSPEKGHFDIILQSHVHSAIIIFITVYN